MCLESNSKPVIPTSVVCVVPVQVEVQIIVPVDSRRLGELGNCQHAALPVEVAQQRLEATVRVRPRAIQVETRRWEE